MRSFFLQTGLTGLYKLLQDKKLLLAAVIYFLVCGSIIFKYGINTGGEAQKYIEDAHRILSGESLRNGFFSVFYVAYSLLISFFIYLSVNLQAVIWLQIIFSFVAACCIYKLLFSITADRKISFAAFVVYLVCFPLQKWNFFLYTESLHASLVTIGLYFFYASFLQQQTKRWWMLLSILLLIIFTRPVGIIFLLTAFIVWITILIKNRRKFIYYPVIILVTVLCIALLQSKFIFYFNPDSLRRMEIICQVPQANAPTDYKEYNGAGLAAFFHVIFSEIGIKAFLLNGVKKLAAFFGMARNFYSTVHNAVLILTAVLLYPFAIAGLFFLKNKRSLFVQVFSAIYIFITAVGIFFTCDEWSNRFLAPVLPFIIILFGFGLYRLKTKLDRKK